MERIVNIPPAATFGWLGLNGTRAEVPEPPEERSLTLGPGEERTLTLAPARPALRFTADLGENAVLRLVQVRRGDGAEEREEAQFSEIAVTCGPGARFEWYRAVLGGAATYDDCTVTLEGAGSSFRADLGYRLRGSEKLDMNVVCVHTGRNTRSEIQAAGALSDRACKLLRGTIDLRRGCAGAKGKETEEVLLMDEAVRNLSLPVILCGEEDVEGDHGATVGRPDEAELYYLESRGLDRGAARETLARGRVDAVLRRLPDPALRSELLPEENDPLIAEEGGGTP